MTAAAGGRDEAAGTAPATRAQAAAVVRYYDQTWWDYRALWLNRRNASMHFGYWDETTPDHSASTVRMNAVIAETVGLRRGQRVLDAGCGVGGTSVWLADHWGCQVTGVSLSAAQVRRARRRAAAFGVADRCTFVQGDFLALEVGAASFDVVWAQESVCHTPDKPAFLREAFRVLRPGGRLVCADFYRTQRQPSAQEARLLAEWLDGWAIPSLASAPTFCGWAAEAGFVDVAVRDLTRGVRPSLRRLHRLGSILQPGAAVLRLLRLRTAVQHGNVRAARRQWDLHERGLWFHGVVTATRPAQRPAPQREPTGAPWAR